jgi:phenylalanyl-tRNA synthetase beta chain
MRVPLSWLREYAAIGPGVEPAEVARRLTAAGLEVESALPVGHDVRGVVVAQVTDVEELTGFSKPIRYCRVATGSAEHSVICGAANFRAGDKVPLAVPGAVLPGGFEIGAKKAYGRMSEGMICSARELAIGDDHTGILVLEPGAPLGAGFADYAGLPDHVFDIAVTPDRGYALSVRGVAREAATAFGVAFTDPARVGVGGDVAVVSGEVYPASIADPTACDRFVLREVRGLDPAATTPLWMRVRLARAGVRTVSLAVDITNYLMIELGQPLHAFDAAALSGPIVVRRARPGERLETLDHVVRELDPGDILITDSSGPISMAGTMGGLATEISQSSRDLVIEAAHFSAQGTAQMSRRHKLSSEASYRFERGVDRELPLYASARAVSMLASLGGAAAIPGCTHAAVDVEPARIAMPASYPGQVAGQMYGQATVIRRLREVGCEVTEAGGAAEPHDHGRHSVGPRLLTVVPPSWRPDLVSPIDLVEEVIRLEGYDNVAVAMPRAQAGRGLTARQRMRRALGRALAGNGCVEVISHPFSSQADHDRLQLAPGDPRRRAVRLANPLSEDEPLLRTTLLPGLLRVLTRNTGRGFGDLGLYELGLVFLPHPDGQRAAPILRVDRGPAVAEVAELEAALPGQPLHAAVVLAGNRETSGWWGPGRPAGWQDAIELARLVPRVSRVPFRVAAGQHAPWHPGRCAALYVTGDSGQEWLAGHAGELHPRVVEAFRLPPRTCAAELDLSVIETAAAAAGPVQAPRVWPYPVASQDIALIVADSVPAAEVEAALAAGARSAGDAVSLEEVRLFDVYTGEPVAPGHKSLAYSLRFRAPDRTLTDEETIAAKDAAFAEAARRVGAVLRDGS